MQTRSHAHVNEVLVILRGAGFDANAG